MIGQGVYARKKRFSFVKGEITNGVPAEGFVPCGDGTAFPMEVPGGSVAEKLDTIAELFFRVKDAQFTAGSVVASGVIGYDEYLAPTTKTEHRAFAETDVSLGINTLSRGYATNGDPASYLTAAYDRGDGEMWRDAANEYGIWGISNDTAFSFLAYLGFVEDPDTPIKTDFFQGRDLYMDYCRCEGVAYFSTQVAVVRSNPTDPLFAATNRFFIAPYFYVTHVFDPPYDMWLSTQESADSYISPIPVCDYVVQLSGTRELRCPIYANFTEGPLGPTYDADGPDSIVGTDFVHEATEWWPYARGNPAEAVWDSDTGLPLPLNHQVLNLNNPAALIFQPAL